MASFAEIHKNTRVTAYDSKDSIFEEEPQESDPEEDIFKTEYRKYLRNKIIYDCLVDCVDDSELSPELGSKLEDIINDMKLKQYLKLENQTLLGFTLKKRELTYQEGEKVKSVLQKKILQKKTKIFEEFKRITSKDLDQVIKEPQLSTSSCKLSLTQRDETLLDYKEKLMKEQQIFTENVTTRTKLLEEMLDLRLKEVPKLCNQASRHCKAKIECNYLKAKIAEYKMKLDIFMEVPKAIEAYQELTKDIKQQQEECELRIEQLKELKLKYEDVSGREYDDILKSYLMYKRSIDELKKMHALVK